MALMQWALLVAGTVLCSDQKFYGLPNPPSTGGVAVRREAKPSPLPSDIDAGELAVLLYKRIKGRLLGGRIREGMTWQEVEKMLAGRRPEGVAVTPEIEEILAGKRNGPAGSLTWQYHSLGFSVTTNQPGYKVLKVDFDPFIPRSPWQIAALRIRPGMTLAQVRTMLIGPGEFCGLRYEGTRTTRITHGWPIGDKILAVEFTARVDDRGEDVPDTTTGEILVEQRVQLSFVDLLRALLGW